jgi:hypothetical protein
MIGDMKTIMEGFGQYTENRLLLRSIRGLVRNATGKAAAGELGPINNIAEAIKAVVSKREINTPEQQIAGRKGDMSQLEAIMTGLGSRIRGGASTRRALAGRNVLTGKKEPPVRGVPESSPARRGDVTGEEIARNRSKPYPRGFVEYPYVAPPESPRGKRQPIAPVSNNIDELVDKYMSDIRRETAGMSDKGYYEGGGKTDSASLTLVSRVRELTAAVKSSLKDIRRNRVTSTIRDANQLESAKAKLEELNREIYASKNSIEALRKLNSPIVVDKETGKPSIAAGGVMKGQSPRRSTSYDVGVRNLDEKVVRQSRGDSSEIGTKEYAVYQTAREYRSALDNKIKILERQVSEGERAIAKFMKNKKLSSKDAGVALRESERSRMNPKRQDIENLRRRIQAHKPDPEEEKLRAQRDLPTVLESMQRQLQEAMAKPVSRPKAGSDRPGAEKRPGYVRTDKPLDEMFAPTRGQSMRDLREPTGGEYSGGVVQERGRPMSDVMKRAQGKVNLKPKKKARETVVQRDARRIRKNRDLAGLIEGLPG